MCFLDIELKTTKTKTDFYIDNKKKLIKKKNL